MYTIPILLLTSLAAAPLARPPASLPPSQSGRALGGVVFVDRNANGRRDDGEPGVRDVAVSDQEHVVVTDAQGAYRIPAAGGFGLVFVSVPDGFISRAPFYRSATGAQPPSAIDFPLVPAPQGATVTFVHASDTHISDASLARTQRLRALVDSIRPAFVLVTGDLVRDALRVGEREATSYYELFASEAARFDRPLWTVPGNHEIFGIERDKSGVSADHPLYGRAMYRRYRGPDYYSFNAGGVHFVGLNTVDIDDTHYYGHVDSLQLAWLTRDLAAIPATMPVITFNHIPFYTAMETVNGYSDAPPAPSVITVGGKSDFRHNVSNAAEVLAGLGARPYPLALGGHVHAPERLRFAGVETRFEQAAAVVGAGGRAGLKLPSGVTVYRLTRGRVDEGRFVELGMNERPESK